MFLLEIGANFNHKGKEFQIIKRFPILTRVK